MSRETATPAELVNLNAGFNPTPWWAGQQINSVTPDQRPPVGRVWSVVWTGVFVTGNSIALTLDRSTGVPSVSVSSLTQAFSASSTATLEALRDQIRALAGVLWCTSSNGSSNPRLDIGFNEGYYGEVSGGTVTGGASQPTVAVTEDSLDGCDVDGFMVAAVDVHILQGLATLTDDDVVYTARRTWEGADGDAITIIKVVAGLNTALSVSVTDLEITINLATDGAGAATTTATQLVDALKNNADAMRLVSVSTSVGATVQTALSASNTLGDGTPGVDRTVNFRVWGFVQNLWRWAVIQGSERTSVAKSESFKVNVGSYLRIYPEITSISGADATVSARAAGCAGGVD